jgi:ABC-type transport system substrate-binding protein
VNRLIDQALAEPDRARRAELWGQLDKQVMRDAPWVPLNSTRSLGQIRGLSGHAAGADCAAWYASLGVRWPWRWMSQELL